MYRAFTISLGDINSLISSDYRLVQDASIYDNVESTVKKQITENTIINSYRNGSKLQDEWFPKLDDKKFHVFISFSGKDIEPVKKFVCWLKQTFNLDCFVDAIYWRYSNDLLKKLDNEWCKTDEGSSGYNYDSRNFTTSNVHCMLSMALMQMIDKCECVLFVDSDNSIKYKKGDSVGQTTSPWIYEELSFVQYIQRREPVRSKPIYESRQFFSNTENLSLTYDVNMKQLTALSAVDFNKLKQYAYTSNLRGEAVLDGLYKMKPIYK